MRKNTCEIESMLSGSSHMCDRTERIVETARLGRKRRGRKKECRMTVDDEGWWYVPMKKKKTRTWL